MHYTMHWRLKETSATSRRSVAAGVGAAVGMRVFLGWTAGDNQRNLGTTSLIELLSPFGKVWVEVVFTGGTWVCPGAPL